MDSQELLLGWKKFGFCGYQENIQISEKIGEEYVDLLLLQEAVDIYLDVWVEYFLLTPYCEKYLCGSIDEIIEIAIEEGRLALMEFTSNLCKGYLGDRFAMSLKSRNSLEELEKQAKVAYENSRNLNKELSKQLGELENILKERENEEKVLKNEHVLYEKKVKEKSNEYIYKILPIYESKQQELVEKEREHEVIICQLAAANFKSVGLKREIAGVSKELKIKKEEIVSVEKEIKKLTCENYEIELEISELSRKNKIIEAEYLESAESIEQTQEKLKETNLNIEKVLLDLAKIDSQILKAQKVSAAKKELLQEKQKKLTQIHIPTFSKPPEPIQVQLEKPFSNVLKENELDYLKISKQNADSDLKQADSDLKKFKLQRPRTSPSASETSESIKLILLSILLAIALSIITF